MDKFRRFSSSVFGDIRITDRDGRPWFVGVDVAKALGYKNPSDAVSKLCKKSIKTTINAICIDGKKTPPTNVTIIPESDAYRLVMRSNLPDAERFQDWVYEEVMPALRDGSMIDMRSMMSRCLQPEDLAKLADAQFFDESDFNLPAETLGNPVAIFDVCKNMYQELARTKKLASFMKDKTGVGEYLLPRAMGFVREYLVNTDKMYRSLATNVLPRLMKQCGGRRKAIGAYLDSTSAFKWGYDKKTQDFLKLKLETEPLFMAFYRRNDVQIAAVEVIEVADEIEEDVVSEVSEDEPVEAEAPAEMSPTEVRQRLIDIRKRTDNVIRTQNVEVTATGRHILDFSGDWLQPKDISWTKNLFTKEALKDEQFWKSFTECLYARAREIRNGRKRLDGKTVFSKECVDKTLDFITKNTNRFKKYRTESLNG